METTKKDTRAKDQAKAQLKSIVGMMKALEEAREADEFAIYEGEEVTADDMEQRIQEDPLCIQVRTDWNSPGGEPEAPTGYNILLCTGGPAVRIIGELSEHGEPESAEIEYQDWFTPWKEYLMSPEDEELVLQYCRQFYFGN